MTMTAPEYFESEESYWEHLVLLTLNRTRPTTPKSMIERIEKVTGCEVLGLASINKAGAKLVERGMVRIVRRDGKILGAVRTMVYP